MYSFSYLSIVEHTYTTVTAVDKKGELRTIPKAFIFGWAEGVLILRGAWCVGASVPESEAVMPKSAAEVGRKECMDAMCHSCEHFNLLGRRDCGKTICPLYTYGPESKHSPDLSWRVLKTKSAVGFSPAKKTGIDNEQLFDAALAATLFRYGSLDAAPGEVRKAIDELSRTANGDKAPPVPNEDRGW